MLNNAWWVLVAAWLAFGLSACETNRDRVSPPTHPAPPPTIPAAAVVHTQTPTVIDPRHTLAGAIPATPAPSPSPTLLPSPTLAPTSAPTPTPWPTPDADAQRRSVRLPILMYHYVEPWPAGADTIRKNLTVRPEDFAAQMQYLHDRGYVTVSLYDLVYALALGRPLPPQAVVITFDDGYRDLMQYAAPAMQPYGYTATVFVITELMDKGLEPYLTWPEAESLYALGWKIEPHTKTHHELKGRSRDFQVYEMLGSVQTVQAHLGVMPRFFNYPSGKYDDLTLQLDREIGLWGGVTVSFGRTHTLASLYTLTRVRVNGQGTFQEFVAGLEGDLQP